MDRLIQLNVFLDGLIEFRLYQPKPDDQPPEGLPPFKAGQVVDYVEQEHHAKRAGRHIDLRLGDRKGMYSWASKKDLAHKTILHPQPIHPQSYNKFQGEIKEGYGAGTVRTKALTQALVTRSDPNQLNISVGRHRLAILKTKIGHLLVREKHPERPLEAVKPQMKSLPPHEAESTLRNLPPGSIVQPKVDGALAFIRTKGGEPEIFSHRDSKRTGKPIIHTERFFGGRPKFDIPKKHQHTLLAELYGERKGKAIPPQELGGILNANLPESLKRQTQGGVKLKAMPFDIVGKGTYPERLAKLRAAFTHLPQDKFTLPESASTPETASSLFKRIRSGKHPATTEGVIIHPPQGKPIKIKNVKEDTVTIHSLFPGKGKFKDSYGGFYYADSKGKPLGRVGTGFTDQGRKDLPSLVGRKARVKYQEKFKSGKLRAPVYVGPHEDY